jgi:DNA repair photolyase
VSLFKGNWELPDSGEKFLPEEEDAIIDKLAKKVVERGMAVPAIMFLESVKPLNFIGAQTLVFFEPIIQTVFNFKDYEAFRTALEKRETIEIILLRIEKYDAVSHAREKRIKKYLKVEKKTWKWYQRYLGVFTPKVEFPDEVLHGPQGKTQKKDEA